MCTVLPVLRRRDPIYVKVVEFRIKEPTVCEAASFCGRVESSKRGITGWLPRIASSSLAITDDRDVSGTIKACDVARTRRYGTLVKGGKVGLDAQIDSIVPKALLRSWIGAHWVIWCRAYVPFGFKCSIRCCCRQESAHAQKDRARKHGGQNTVGRPFLDSQGVRVLSKVCRW